MLKRSTTLVVVVRHSAVSEDKTFLIVCFYCLSLLLSCFPFSSLPPLIPPFFSPSSSSVETWWRGLARTTLSTTWWPRISELTQVGRGRWGGEGKGKRGEEKRGGGKEGGRVGGRCMYLRANPVTLYIPSAYSAIGLFSRQEERGGRLEGAGCKEQDHQGHG